MEMESNDLTPPYKAGIVTHILEMGNLKLRGIDSLAQKCRAMLASLSPQCPVLLSNTSGLSPHTPLRAHHHPLPNVGGSKPQPSPPRTSTASFTGWPPCLWSPHHQPEIALYTTTSYYPHLKFSWLPTALQIKCSLPNRVRRLSPVSPPYVPLSLAPSFLILQPLPIEPLLVSPKGQVHAVWTPHWPVRSGLY